MSMSEIFEDLVEGTIMGVVGAVMFAPATIFVPASGLAGLLGAGTTVSALPTIGALVKGAVVGNGLKYAYTKYGKPYLVKATPATPAAPLAIAAALEELNNMKQIVFDLQMAAAAAAAAAEESAKAAAAKTNMKVMLTGLNCAQADIDRILAAMP